MNCESCGHENLEEARFCAKCGVQLSSHSEENGWIGRLVGGRFLVKSVLGEGGMGIVYEGEQHMGSKTRKVAIKTLHAHLSSDASVLARFHRECGTVSGLEHPNTIKFYDFGSEADGTLYIAMEFIDGKALDEVVSEAGRLPPERAVKILSQICGALDEAHDQGIIHRDLKPENIVLTERLGKKDFVKVLDFGIAARTESASAEQEAKLTQQGMVLGTPPYMSPEQFTGVELDRRSDVYSLGCMAYEMLTGQLPFSANTPWQWATEHMTAQPFPMEQVPNGAAIPVQMREAVMKALEKDPDDRPRTAGEFLRALEKGAASAAQMSAAPTEAMQAMPAAFTSQTNLRPPVDTETQSEMSATQGFEALPKKSSAPLMIGGLVLLLALGGGAVAMMGGGGSQAEADAVDADATPEDAASPSEPTTAVAQQPEEPSSQEKLPSDQKTPEVTAPATSPAPRASPTPTPTPSPAPSPTPSPTPAPSPAPKPVPDPTPSVNCSQCVSLARAGKFSPAAAIFSQCPSVQKACGDAARTTATGQIDSAVEKGQCSKAQSIINDAAKLKAASARLRAKVSSCK